MLRKISLLLPHLFCNVEFEFSSFYNTKQSLEILTLKIEMLLEFQFRRILKLLGSGCLQDISSRRLQDMSSRRLQRNNFLSSKTSSRRLARCLQDVFKKVCYWLSRKQSTSNYISLYRDMCILLAFP